MIFSINNIFSSACGIPDPENKEIIITGGVYTRTKVSVYNEAGHQRDLADLKQGRFWYHTCTMFVGNGGKKVKIFYIQTHNHILSKSLLSAPDGHRRSRPSQWSLYSS